MKFIAILVYLLISLGVAIAEGRRTTTSDGVTAFFAWPLPASVIVGVKIADTLFANRPRP